MVAASLGEYDSLHWLADRAGERGPDFQPDSAFQYSETGFDVLGGSPPGAWGIWFTMNWK
jgi:hypothetical protein